MKQAGRAGNETVVGGGEGGDPDHFTVRYLLWILPRERGVDVIYVGLSLLNGRLHHL